MTTASITSIPAAPPGIVADRTADLRQTATNRLEAQQPVTPKAPFNPQPALRPTIQDRIEIDRALLALRAAQTS